MKFLNPLRLFIFVISVVALANFFEAGRLISSEQNLNHIWMSVLSFLILAFSLFVMGYLIYKDEKKKGTLKVKIKVYEKISKTFRRNLE